MSLSSQDLPGASLAPDLHGHEFENDPIETLNRLRREDPVHFSRHGFWYLTWLKRLPALYPPRAAVQP